MANAGRNDLLMLENGVKKASIISSSSHATWEGAFLNSCLTLLHEWKKHLHGASGWCGQPGKGGRTPSCGEPSYRMGFGRSRISAQL